MLKYSTLHESKPLTTGSIATLQIPTGGKIQSMMLLFTTSAGAAVTEAQIRSEISNIRLTIGGQDVVNATPVQILDTYEFLSVKVGTPGAIAGVVELNLGRLVYNIAENRDLMGFGTADVANIQVQVTCGTLSAIANVQAVTSRTAEQEKLGAYCRLLNYPQSFNATGQHTVDTLPRDIDTSYLALLIDDGASGTITSSEVRVNTNTIRENVPNAVNQLMLSNNGFAQPAGYFVHAFADGSLSTRLPMPNVSDFRVLTTFSVAPGAGGYSIAALSLRTPGQTAT